MLNNIKLENFKCFEKLSFNLKDITIIVGKNNAGKSCLIEALRLISIATKKSTKTTYVDAPTCFNLPNSYKGFRIDVAKLKIDLKSIVYFYKDNCYAKITALFKDKKTIEIYLNKEIAFVCLFDKDKKIIKNKNGCLNNPFSNIGILPQIGLIKENEKKLETSTINNDQDSYLSSRHFRNQIYLYKNQYFTEFKNLAETTWEGLSIDEIIYDYGENLISLFIKDNHFPAEIGMMGSGLQMWLQIIWFLARSKDCETLILDEPDVYMHPDLQTKILKIVKNKFKQVIIATHSVEIISAVDPTKIANVDKKTKNIKYASDSKGGAKNY